MRCQSLLFRGAGDSVIDEASALSAGREPWLYRGQWPKADLHCPAQVSSVRRHLQEPTRLGDSFLSRLEEAGFWQFAWVVEKN